MGYGHLPSRPEDPDHFKKSFLFIRKMRKRGKTGHEIKLARTERNRFHTAVQKHRIHKFASLCSLLQHLKRKVHGSQSAFVTDCIAQEWKKNTGARANVKHRVTGSQSKRVDQV